MLYSQHKCFYRVAMTSWQDANVNISVIGEGFDKGQMTKDLLLAPLSEGHSSELLKIL